MIIQILVIVAVSVISFSVGYFLKQKSLYNSIKLLLNEIIEITHKHKQERSHANELFNMAEHREQIREQITKLSMQQQKVQNMITDIEQEYLNKLRVIEEKQVSERKSHERLEQLKSKSSALNQ